MLAGDMDKATLLVHTTKTAAPRPVGSHRARCGS